MITDVYQEPRNVNKQALIWQLAPAVAHEDDRELAALLSDLKWDRPWGARRLADRKLGYMGSRASVPALVDAFPEGSFWMVRRAMIQAQEKFGGSRALPTLRQVATADPFQVVHSHAAKAAVTIAAKG